MNTIQKIISSVVLVSVITGCSSKEENKNETAQTNTPIEVTVGKPSENNDNSLAVSGQIESSQTVNISTRIMGYITKLNVKVGDYVKAGQLLASINSTDIVAKRAQVDAMIGEADAAFQNAQKDLDRFTILNKQQSATAKELDNVTLQYNSVKAKLEAAKQMRNEINASLAYTQLTAPFAGIVTQKFAEAGSMASPGMPIVTIEQSGSLQISANIPETEIQHIHMNDATVVTVKSLNKTFQSKIVQINPSSQFTGGQYVVKMQIPDADKKQVYAGMYVNISIPLKGKNVQNKTSTNSITVPTTSIVNRDQLTGLYVVNNNTAFLRWVRLGKIYGNNIEVLSGLSANDEYVVDAKGKLYNGATITIKK